MQPNQAQTSPTMATNQPFSNAPGMQPKNHQALLWCLGILTVISIVAAVAFAYLYFTAPASTPTTEIEDNVTEVTNETEEIATPSTISNAAAQSIADPYLEEFYYLNNVLDHDFDESAKVEIAYLNVSPKLITSAPTPDGAPAFNIDYYNFNAKYRQLFGSNTELPKQSFSTDHTSEITYNAATDNYTIKNIGSGGTGMAMFSIVKSAENNGDNLSIEVYHDQIPLCDANPNGGYCYNSNDLPIASDNAIFQNFSDTIPVYKMIFSQNNGRYVLTDIQK